MTMTASDLASQLTTLIDQRVEGTLTDTTFGTAMNSLFTTWLSQSLSTAGLALSVQDLTTRSAAFWGSVGDWATGSVTGGPTSNGIYPVTDISGITVNLPCLALMTANYRGGPGTDLGNISGNVTIDATKDVIFPATLTGDVTFQAPTGVGTWDRIQLNLRQDATGGRTAAFADGAGFLVPTGFQLSTSPDAVDSMVWENTPWGIQVSVSNSDTLLGSSAKRALGASVGDPGTGTLEFIRPPVAMTGASFAFALADAGQVLLRSHGGSAMADTLPNLGTDPKVNGVRYVVHNIDASANDTVSAAAGEYIATSAGNVASYAVEPGRDVEFVRDIALPGYRIAHNDSSKVLASAPSLSLAVTCASVGDLAVTYATNAAGAHVFWEGGRKLVHIAANLNFTPTFTTASSALYVTGAPYAANSSYSQSINLGSWVSNATGSTYNAWPGAGTARSAVINAGESRFRFNFGKSASADTTANITHLTSGQPTQINFAGPYQAQ